MRPQRARGGRRLTTHTPAPAAFRPGVSRAEGNPYEAAFNRVMAAGATPATAAPESRKEHRSMKAAAAALNAGSWDVNASAV